MNGKENIKISVAFTLDNIEQIRRFFTILLLYHNQPYVESLQDTIEDLEEKKKRLEDEISALLKKKAQLVIETAQTEGEAVKKGMEKMVNPETE